jgi:microcystin-dependent protein
MASITNVISNYKSLNTDLSGRQQLKTPAGSLAQVMKELHLIYVPTGAVMPFAGIIAPATFLICDGSAVNRNVYSDLFEVIGTFYGAGDGVTTFNLPDLRGRVISGYNGAVSYYNAMGKTGGENTHILTVDEMPSHDHDGETQTNTTGITNNTNTTGITNNTNTTGITNNTNTTGITNNTSTTGVTTQTAGDHTHTSNAVGGQGNYGLALADGTNTVTSTDSSSGELNVWTVPGTLSINNAGSHTHAITDPSHTHTVADPGHTHTVTDPSHTHTVTDPSHTHTVTDPGHKHDINSQGGGQAHNNLQPYLVMNYIIKI